MSSTEKYHFNNDVSLPEQKLSSKCHFSVEANNFKKIIWTNYLTCFTFNLVKELFNKTFQLSLIFLQVKLELVSKIALLALVMKY